MTTIRVTTAAGTKASNVGDRHSYGGVSWRNSIDCCDSDGCGRVFFDCTDEEAAAYLCGELDKDDEVDSYDVPGGVRA